MDFAEWLRKNMRDRHLTQRQVAWRVGVDHGTISRLLAGRPPTGRTLARLGRLFGWPPFDTVDPPTSAKGSDRPKENEDA